MFQVSYCSGGKNLFTTHNTLYQYKKQKSVCICLQCAEKKTRITTNSKLLVLITFLRILNIVGFGEIHDVL